MFSLISQLIETYRTKATLAARRIESLLSPVAAIVLALHHAITSWEGASLILGGNMSLGLSSVYLSYFTKFFKPVKETSSYQLRLSRPEPLECLLERMPATRGS
jgi:ABC-type multidrug transport system fused ATPase/permease subunit